MWRPLAATTHKISRPYGRGTSFVVSFVVAMNRVDVVDLVVDLVDVDLDVDVDLVDVVSLSSGRIFIFWPLGPRLYFKFFSLDYISVNQVWLGPKGKNTQI